MPAVTENIVNKDVEAVEAVEAVEVNMNLIHLPC